jgi:hypothetical protein
MSRKVVVNVRRTNGELTVWLFNHNVPVADLKRSWRDPISPFYGPLNDTPIRSEIDVYEPEQYLD